MEREVINTTASPEAIGPYEQAIRARGFLYTSGQIPLDPNTMEIVPGGIAEQTERVMQNLMKLLEAGGASADSVVKTVCFLSDMENFAAFNEVYGRYLGENSPARSCVEVARLPKDVLVEVEAIAISK